MVIVPYLSSNISGHTNMILIQLYGAKKNGVGMEC